MTGREVIRLALFDRADIERGISATIAEGIVAASDGPADVARARNALRDLRDKAKSEERSFWFILDDAIAMLDGDTGNPHVSPRSVSFGTVES